MARSRGLLFAVATVTLGLLGASPVGASVAATPETTPPPRMAQDEPAACLIGSHNGVDAADAESAATLVCGELQALGLASGVPVEEAPDAATAYRVSLSRLGESLVLLVDYESPVGSFQRRERRQIQRVDDLFEVAPAIASAFAGPPPTADVAVTEPAPTPAPTPAPVAVTQPPPSGAACLIGEHAGVPPSDAETAAGLVCDELRRRGIDVGAPTTSFAPGQAAYRTTMRGLGGLVILEVNQEVPAGTVRDSRRLQLDSVEEVTVAAPRLVESLVTGVPIEETARYETLVGEETRQPGSRAGETFWGIGIVGAAMPSTDVLAAPGLTVKFFYEADRFAIGSDLLFAGGPADDEQALFFAWSVGGRYLFGPGNGTFFAGGGFSWDTVGAYTGPKDDRREGATTGVGFYGEVGWEFFRHYESRLMVTLRVDVPFFQTDREYTPVGSDITQVDEIYIVPISLGVAYAW